MTKARDKENSENDRAASCPAELTYVSDLEPGIRRLRTRGGFRYVHPDGRAAREDATLTRIRKLAIPPVWQDVWIATEPSGHLQATGRDARGRKQYRYHALWRETRDQTKFHRLIAFAEALPAIRERIAAGLALRGLPRDKVLATIVSLLESTLIRVGNQEYARDNKSYGLTTLHNRHVSVSGTQLRFEFRGKSGKSHSISVRDRRLARIVRQCQEIKGQQLFQYLDEEGGRHSVTSGDVNDYLREAAGDSFTAKDYRTWAGTVLAVMAFDECEEPEPPKSVVNLGIERVAQALGNTPAVCRKSYIHPDVIECFVAGELGGSLKRLRVTAPKVEGLTPEEALVLALLRSLGRRRKRAA